MVNKYVVNQCEEAIETFNSIDTILKSPELADNAEGFLSSHIPSCESCRRDLNARADKVDKALNQDLRGIHYLVGGSDVDHASFRETLKLIKKRFDRIRLPLEDIF